MRLLNSKRHGQPRPTSRVTTFFKTPVAYDVGDDHAFSTSSNGYGPQVIPDRGFRPNNIPTPQTEDAVVPATCSNRRPDSPVSDSSSTRRRHIEPWSDTTVSGPSSMDTPPKQANREREHASETNRNGLWKWISYVPQSADDETVIFRVKEVFLFAEQFVNNFYSDRKTTNEVALEVLDKVNRSQLLPKSQLQEVLIRASYPTIVIKHILISLMLDLIAFHLVSSEGCLLPKEFQNYIALAKARTRSSADEIPHVQPALSTYRVLSAYIHSDFESDQNYLDDKRRISKEMAVDFRSAFDQWLEEDKTKEAWESSFDRLMNKIAGLGTFLFCQPSVFFFHWELSYEEQSARLIPVSPRLLRVYDEEAQFQEFADLMIEMKCEKVFESSASEGQK